MDFKLLVCPKNEEILLKNDKYVIGRGRTCSYIIESLSISRNHLQFDRDCDTWTALDLSTNGVLLNGIRMTKHEKHKLKTGDTFILSEEIKVQFEKVNQTSDADVTQIHPLQSLELLKGGSIVDLTNSPSVATTQEDSASCSQSEWNDELTCSICLELFIKSVTLNCQHSFCESCINFWRKNNHICPICRASIKSQNGSLALDHIIEKTINKMPKEVKDRREDIIKERMKEQVEAAKGVAARGTNRRGRGGRGRGAGTSGRRGRGRGRGPMNMTPIEISSSDDDIDIDDDELDMHLLSYDLIEHYMEGLDEDDETDYDIGAAAYYGGYGTCYICHMPGHWANGCPNRVSRH